LKQGGRAYLSFPPFYSPVGGHSLKPYHLLGEKLGIWVWKQFNRNKRHREMCSFENWNLYPRTIKNVKEWVIRWGFYIEDLSVRFIPINLARIPFLGEFLTWHAQFLLSKKWLSQC